MKITDSIRQFLGINLVKQVDQADRPPLRASFLRGQPIPAAMKATEYLNQYKGWVYTAVTAITQETANIELELKRRKGQNEVEIVETHPALDLLYNVNPIYTSYHLWEATQAYLELLGESYWWLVGDKKKPKEIWVLRPDWLKVKDTKNKMIESYSYGPPSETLETIPYEEVIPFKDFNPLNPYRGYGTVKALAEAIDTENEANAYNRNFFKNGSRPGGALETDQALTDDQYERVRTSWEQVHKGNENSWKVAILEGGLKWKDVGLSQKDMDYIEGRRYTRDEILAAYRVPKPIVAVNDDVNRAAAREARAVFLENVIEHKMRRLVAHLNEFFLPRFGDKNLFFDFKSPVPNDADMDLKYYDNGLRHGWLTRNEVREMQGLDPLDGGDTLLVPFGLSDVSAPVDDQNNGGNSGKEDENVDKSKKTRAIKANVRIAPMSSEEKTTEDLIESISLGAERMLKKMLMHKYHDKNVDNSDEVVDIEDQEPDQRQVTWRSLVKRTDDREAMIIKILAELFANQEQSVKDRLAEGISKYFDKKGEKVKSVTKVKASVNEIADVTKDNDVFAAPLMNFIKSIIETEGILQIHSVDPNAVFYMASKAVQKYLKNEGAKFVVAVNEETRDQLRTTLADGVDAGESINQLRDRVAEVFTDAKTYRSERIARTEVIRSTNFATEEAYRQSEVVEAKEWLTAEDELVCPFCAPYNGKVLGLGETFAKKGETISGKDPATGNTVRLTIGLSNVDYPPLHPNCRCTLIPVLKSTKAMKKEKQGVDTKQLLTGLVDATLKETKQMLDSNGKEGQDLV